MKLSVWITFWILVLLDYIFASPIPQWEDFEYEDLKEIQCPEDSTFYTPKDIKTECITAALNCFLEDFSGVVRFECSYPNEAILRTLEHLETLQKSRLQAGHNISRTNECACERYPQTPYGEFLEGISSLLQQIHSQEKGTVA